MGSKATRKIPPVLIKYLEEKHSKEFADWYVREANRGKRQITQERQRMSAESGKVGGWHEGHFRAGEDLDRRLGGGSTSGLNMRPEIGAVNVAHKDLPRIDYEDMRAAGIPQNWVEDVYETVLESEGLGVIGSYDTTGALDMDYGMDPGQAQAQTDRRRQLRAQGVEVVGPETKVEFQPFKGEIPSKSDVPLPNLTEALAVERGIEKQQIAARRSTRLKVKGGVARVLSVPLVGGAVAGALTLAEGGTPAQAFGSLVEAENPIENLDAGPIFDESQDFGETLQQSRQQNARPLMDRLDEGALGDAGRAIKRGGRLSIGAHGAKFTLPEFGFSEFFGIN
jgi:hypothetical protein